MATPKLCQLVLLSIALACAAPTQADDSVGQTLQINTHFNTIVGKPTWLLIIRDVTSGRVLPYLFDIRNNDNFWVAFTSGHSYRVTASTLKFGPYAKINNFCNLENGILNGKSMWITLTGALSPDTHSFRCHVTQYPDSNFTIVDPQT